MYSPTFDAQDVEILRRDRVWQGFFAVDRITLRHRLYAGGWTQPFSRELFCRGDAAGVLLHDPQRQELVLVEQFRVGVIDDDSQSPWVLELVAGMLDDGETTHDMAVREVREEAGLAVTGLQHICRYYNSPGGSDESISVLYGQVDASTASGIHGLAEEHEDIRVVVVPVQEALQMLAQGRINNAMAIIALQWFQLHVHRV